MIKTLLEGLTLGLSTGSICLISCTPIYLPYLVSENRSFAKNIFKVFEISLGRFFSYIVFGLMAGWLGSNIGEINRDLFTGIAYILLSIFLGLSVLRTKKKKDGCHIPKFMKITSSAFLLGVFTGINFCPSFLIALSKAVDLAGPLSGALLFVGFFFGTSVFLLPLAFSGFLAQVKKLKLIAQIASICIAVWFIYSGGMKFHEYYQHRQAIYVDPVEENYSLALLSGPNHQEYYDKVAISLFNFKKDKFSHTQIKELTNQELQSFNNKTILIIDKSLLDEDKEKLLANYHHYILEEDYPIENLVQFLNNSVMKLAPNKYINFSFENSTQEHSH